MSLITPDLSGIVDGQTADASDFTNPLNTIIDDYNGNITNDNIASSAAISISKLATSAWSTYTPSLTSSSGSPDIGNGTSFGRYQKVGRSVTAVGRVVWGSSTTNGTGNLRISLPFTAADNNSINYIGSAWIEDNGTKLYGTIARVGGGTDYCLFYVDQSTAAASYTNVFTFTENDKVEFTITYESAS